ncbi:MAG: ATP-binding protein [Fuerstiella sp.]
MTDHHDEFWTEFRNVKLIEECNARRLHSATTADGARVSICELVDWYNIPATTRARIQHEIEQLATIDEQRLLRPTTVHLNGDPAAVVCPLPVATPLEEAIQTGLSLRQTLDIACDLLQLMVEVHRKSLVLRCIRPSEVFLHNENGRRRSILGGCPPLNLLQDDTDTKSVSATLIYSAPETLGALEYDVRAPADLYSLGVVLFSCLVGLPPFSGDTARDLLFHHVTTPVPDVRRIDPSIPPPIAEVVTRLLQKHPRDRYQSAQGVLFDLRQLRSIYCADHEVCSVKPVVLGTKDNRETLIEPAYVGRDSEIQRLSQLVDKVKKGRSQTALVMAPSGVGKSRLLQEVTTIAAGSGFRLLRAEGQNQVGLRPLATMQPAIEACCEILLSDDDLRGRLHDHMLDYATEITAASQQLADALQLQSAARNDRELSDRRIAMALAILFGRLASEQTPVMLLVDDAQWADDLTLSILDCWQLAKPRRTLLVVASRPSDRLTENLRRSLKVSEELQLKPLARADSDLLLESMAGVLPREICDTVWDMAHGNPFVSSAVLRGLFEAEALQPSEDGWLLNEDKLRHLQTSGEAAEILKQRLDRLPEPSRQLLAMGAVLGKRFSLETAARLNGIPFDTAIRHLAAPREQHLIWEQPTEGTCQFVHDQIREAVLDSLEAQQLAGIHRLAADYLALTTPDHHFEIASHYDAAGCPEEALEPATLAGCDARDRHALEIAQQQFEIALRSCEALGQTPSFEVLNGAGCVMMLSGHYAAAQSMLEEALTQTSDAVSEADIILKLGELAFKRDDKEEAVRLWESALKKLKGRLPAPWMMPLHTFREISVQALHTCFPRWFVRSRTAEASERDRLICRLYSRLAYGYWYLKGKIPLLFVHLRGMNIAERFAPTPELAQAYSEHAPAMSLIPLRRRGIAYGRRSLEIRTELDDVWGQGQSLHFLAIALYAAGRFEECVEVGRRSVRILERAGDIWEKHVALYQVAASLLRMGRLTEAAQIARETYDSGLAVGDEQACGNMVDIWARASNGDLPAEVIQAELDRPRADVQGRAHVLLARGVQLVAEHRFSDATKAFDEGIRIARAAGISNCYTSPLFAWKATSVRRFLEEDSPLIRRARQSTIRKHRRTAWTAVLMGLRFRADLPHALRELAWCFIFQNRIRRASWLLRWSIKVAAAQNADWEQRQSELVLQQIRVERGCLGAIERLKQAQDRVLAFRAEQLPKRVPNSLSLLDRFDSLLDAGRQIASANDPGEIIEHTVAAGQQLLRSDFCRIVSIDADGKPINASDALREAVEVSRASRMPEIATKPSREFRSLISAPILVRTDCVACLVVGNSEVRDLYGENEERIMSYITTICGAALENAESFRNLKRLNENLENIVSERTAAVEARSRELQRTADILREAQVDLAHARDAAQVANQAKTDFLAHMSHEIRTPIGAVLGFTELLMNGEHPLHTDQRQQLRRVHSNGTHLLQLLNDLLDLSKIEAGQLTIECLPCKPFEVLADIVASLESRAIEKGIGLTLRVTNYIPGAIHTDPTRLRQIITNLVGNAIKFTEDGSVDVLVTTREDQGKIQIAVRDSGVGIPADALTDVFEPFRQADESVNRKFGGTGLGLPISRKLARALGGDISVQSEPGAGSTFTVTIDTGALVNVPLLTQSEASQQATDASTTPVDEIDLHGIRILIADDIEANREFLAHVLCHSGAEVRCVENGQLAVEEALSNPSDLILMDMRMPVMDGYTAVGILRDAGVTIPIIALTANGMAEDERKCRDAGCSDYLTKPIAMHDLLQGIDRQLPERMARTAKKQDAEIKSNAGSNETVEPAADDLHAVSQSAVNAQFDPTTVATDHSAQQLTTETLAPLPDEPVESIRSTIASTVTPPAPKTRPDIQLPEEPFMLDLCGQLVQKLKTVLPDVKSAVVDGETKVLAEQGHWMKGTGGTVGLPIFTDIGRELEVAARASEIETAATIVVRLEETIALVEELL